MVAAIFREVMCVDAENSLTTAAQIGNLRPWVTDRYQHDGLDADPGVLETLVAMAHAPMGSPNSGPEPGVSGPGPRTATSRSDG